MDFIFFVVAAAAVEVPGGGAVLKASPPPSPSCFSASRDYGSRDEPGESCDPGSTSKVRVEVNQVG